ncbi:hypothetical protein HYH03_011686 [Edaphochlamys debaryana]|uniref:Domain of unknown function at the cortex 1 domain-containing protein n=1 Tax=Edaphochlamys debaryana TaxID=47281 RepID=A0A835XUA6_9CHLO|nr:hypothetical protein HYH03_011686 [Edaphochlamys debaryana]|eukprot:KAG2489884.1 hypothetical protein HYH03_011686 [Edaphochlamys debaryana]
MSLTPSVLKLLAFGLVGCFLQQSLLLVILLALIQRLPTTTNNYNSTGDGSTGGGQAWLAVTAAVTAAGAGALTGLALALAAAAALAQGLKAAAAAERRTPHECEGEPGLSGSTAAAAAVVTAPAASLPSPPPDAPSPPPTPPLPARPAVAPAAFCETLAAALEGRAGAPAQPSLPLLARPHPRPAASSPDPAAVPCRRGGPSVHSGALSKAATPEPNSASGGASPFAIASSPSLPTSSSCLGLGRARPPVASHDPTLDGADSAASAGGGGSGSGGSSGSGSIKKRLQHVARALTAPLRRRRTKSSAVPLAAAPEQSLASVSAPPATLVASAAAAAAEENDVRRQASDKGTSTVEVRGPAAAEAAATARGRHSPASALAVTAKPWPPAPLHRLSAAGRAGDDAEAPPNAPSLDVPEAAAAGAEQHGSALTQALPPPATAAAATAAAATSAASAAATSAWCAAVPSPSDFAASPDAPLLLTTTFGEPSFAPVTSFTFTPPAAPPAVNSHVLPSTSASSGVQPNSTPQAAQQSDWQQAASLLLPRRVSANDPAVRLRVECGLFSGEALVLVQGLASTPRSLFQGRSRRSWVALQGRFKAPVRLDSLVTGQEFSRPFRRLPPAWMVEWGLLGLARKVSNGAASIGPMSAPSLLMPVIAAASVLNVSEPACMLYGSLIPPASPFSSRESWATPLALARNFAPAGSRPPLLEAQEDVRLFAPHLAAPPPHGSPGPSRPADAPTRKRHFSAARHREGLSYDTRHVWTFHFCQQFVDLSAYRLDFGCATYDLARHLDGQPLQFMTKDVDSGSYLFQVLAWHQRLLTEAAAAAGQGADDTA